VATLPDGDVTTQVAIYRDANAAGADANTKLNTALAISTTLPATTDETTHFAKFIAR
jgi:hypothetical protein